MDIILRHLQLWQKNQKAIMHGPNETYRAVATIWSSSLLWLIDALKCPYASVEYRDKGCLCRGHEAVPNNIKTQNQFTIWLQL